MQVDQTQRRLRYKLAVLIVVLVAIVLLALAWSFSSLRQWLDIERIVTTLRNFSGGFGPVIAISTFSVALIFSVPLTFLTLVFIVAFGPLHGFVYVMLGAQISALCSYGLGATLGRDIVRKLGGVFVNSVSQKLAKRGLVAVIVVRMVPVAPFAVVNMIAGASHIGLRDLLLGTLLGMVPGTLAIAFFIEKIIDTLRTPGSNSGIVVLTLALVAIGLGIAKTWLGATSR
jgi:uncharacterized membrane protein YdjX (TVP38/TMEM64 family)